MAGFSDALTGASNAGPAPQMADSDMPPVEMGGQIGQQGQPVTPEMQDEYTKFVSLGILMLLNEKTLTATVELFEETPNVVDSVAQVASSIVVRLYASAKQQGQEVSPEVVLHGGWEILNETAALAAKAGAQELTPDEIEDAFYIAADKVRAMMEKEGLIDEGATDPDTAVEQMRAQMGDDGIKAVMDRAQQVQQRTVEGLRSKVGGAGGGQGGAPAPMQQEMQA